MQGDPVHPGPPGQLTMAAALLKELGAEGFVSSATVAMNGKVEAKGCVVDGVKSEGGKLSFDRLDECLPFPIPDDARAVLPLFPTILELSQYTLKVTGLTGERYVLHANDTPLATLTAKELEAGVNLTGFATGPIAAQGKAVLAAVNAKERLVGQWRGQSRDAIAAEAAPELKEKFAVLTKKWRKPTARSAKPRSRRSCTSKWSRRTDPDPRILPRSRHRAAHLRASVLIGAHPKRLGTARAGETIFQARV